MEKLKKTWLCYNQPHKRDSWLLWGEIENKYFEELKLQHPSVVNGLYKYRWPNSYATCIVNIPEAESWELNLLRDDQLETLCSAM